MISSNHRGSQSQIHKERKRDVTNDAKEHEVSIQQWLGETRTRELLSGFAEEIVVGVESGQLSPFIIYWENYASPQSSLEYEETICKQACLI